MWYFQFPPTISSYISCASLTSHVNQLSPSNNSLHTEPYLLLLGNIYSNYIPITNLQKSPVQLHVHSINTLWLSSYLVAWLQALIGIYYVGNFVCASMYSVKSCMFDLIIFSSSLLLRWYPYQSNQIQVETMRLSHISIYGCSVVIGCTFTQ